MARVVVVGAGIAGLCTAARLADLGHEVTVVDRQPEAGGQLRPVRTEGLAWPAGPATFTLPAVFRDLFRATGRPIEREVELVPVDPAVRFVFPDGQALDLPNASRDGAMRAFGTFGTRAAADWDTLVRHGRHTWSTLRSQVTAPRRRGLDLGLACARHRRPRIRDPRVVAILGSYAAAMGADPTLATGAATVLPYLDQAFGTWTVEPALTRLVEAIAGRARERGATLRLGTTVRAIDTDHGAVCRVRLTDGEHLPADVVVATAHPGAVADLLGPRPPRRRPARPRGGRSVFTVAVTAPDVPSDVPRRTVILPAGTGRPHVTVERWGTTVVLSADCPAGDTAEARDWTTDPTARAHTLIGTVRAATGILGKHVTINDVRTPADLQRDFDIPAGRVHGGPVAGWPTCTAIVRRAANQTPIRGLLLAGAGSHPGPGVPFAAISAQIVADRVGRA